MDYVNDREQAKSYQGLPESYHRCITNVEIASMCNIFFCKQCNCSTVFDVSKKLTRKFLSVSRPANVSPPTLGKQPS